jgi:hypothetical protein
MAGETDCVYRPVKYPLGAGACAATKAFEKSRASTAALAAAALLQPLTLSS